MQITPGLMIRGDMVQFTIDDKITINKDANNSSVNSSQNDKDHDIWAGVGEDKWHLAFYSKYVNDFAFARFLFF